MNEPRRLLSGSSDATALERRLLGAGRARGEPEGMRDRVKLGITAAVTAGAITTSATSAKAATASVATKATLGGGALAKATLVLVAAALVTTAGATTYLATKDPPPPPTVAVATAATAATPPTVAASALPTTAIVAPIDLPTATPVASAIAPRARSPVARPIDPRPTPSAAPVSAPSVAQSELREEAMLVDQARSALASGDLVAANDRLAQANARFPQGRLGEEREALAVRVAAASGDGPRAARLARTFLDRHPTSPLRPSMESIAKKAQSSDGNVVPPALTAK